jgi:acetyl esterase/lipase
MEVQWLLLAFSLALTTMTVSAYVSPNGLVRGNLAWFACAWLATEFAPWLVLTTGMLLTVFAEFRGDFGDGPGRLAALLLAASAGGLLAVAARSRRAPTLLEDALRTGLGRHYLKEVPPERLLACTDEVPLHEYLTVLPRRTRAVELVANIPYPGGHVRNVLDIYRPAGGCAHAPVLLQIHGGDWTAGHKRQQALPLMHHLARLGWIVVAPNYRLGPEARFPAQLIDCKSAMAWVRAHIASFGGDPGFIAVTGGGAGAHLASLLALTHGDMELQPGFEHVDTRPSACVPLHGVYDLADRRQRDPGRRTRLAWLAHHLMPGTFETDAAAWNRASPLMRLREDAPPFFVLHGTHDSLVHVDEAREFARALHEISNQPVVYAELAGAQHGWDTLRSPRSLHTVRAVTRFLEWCAARHRARGSQRDNADRARS